MTDRTYKLTDVLLPNIGKYQLSEEIGSGAYGVVYKGFRKDDSKTIALKRIFITDKDGNNNIPLSTHRELFVLKRLNSFGNQNIIKLYDVVLNRIDSKLCIDLIFELGDYDLEKYLKKFNSRGDMPVKKIMNLTWQLVNGIYFIHSYCIIHRDLKPANILINREGTHLKITDFGLARILGFNASLTPVVVTLRYRSPEILLRRSYLTACDIWSAGCIFGEMIYGRPIFAGKNEMSQIEAIVTRLGFEAIDNWPDNNIIDGSALVRLLNDSCSLDSILNRVDKLILDLIKKFLRFNPNDRITSCEALKELDQLEINSTYTFGSITMFDPPVQLNQQPLPLNSSITISENQTNRPSILVPNPATAMVATMETKEFSTSKVPASVSLSTVNDKCINCRFPTATAPGISGLGCVGNGCEIDAQNQLINSLDKNVLDDNNILPLQSPNNQLVNQNEDVEEKEVADVIIDETESISNYPHEQVEIFSHEEREEDNENEESECSEEYYDIKEEDNENEESECSEEYYDIKEEDNENEEKEYSEECDDSKTGLQRTNSTPFKEINDKTRLVNSNNVPGSCHLISDLFLRKRVFHYEDSDESENNEIKHQFSPITDHSDSANNNNNDANSNDVNISTKPNLMRQKSLRRRISVLGPYMFTEAERVQEDNMDQRLWMGGSTTSSSLLRRTGSVLVNAPISENVDNDDDIDKDGYISFGEQSLSGALDSVKSSRLSDRPKIVARRRSQISKPP